MDLLLAEMRLFFHQMADPADFHLPYLERERPYRRPTSRPVAGRGRRGGLTATSPPPSAQLVAAFAR